MNEVANPTEVSPQVVRPRPFYWAASGWLALSLAVASLSVPREDVPRAAAWVVILFVVAAADLVSIARLVSAVFDLMSATAENRGARIIQASYWGILKLACLGIFTILVFKGQQVPVTSLLLGVGTMVCVPLIGGFLWSKGF
jgi:hypothetical protein